MPNTDHDLEPEIIEGEENIDGQEEQDEVSVLRQALQRVADERDKFQDQLLRNVADFQNFKKRADAERVKLFQTANKQLILDLLPVVDNFERSIKSLESGASMESVIGGIQAVERQVKAVLEAYNVKRIPAEGHSFDPEMHEAVATHETDEHPENMVVDELEAGYKLSDEIIRPAKVRVSKSK